MAERLVAHHSARLVLFGRTPIPPRDTWDAVIADPAASEEVKRRLSALRALAAKGGEYVVVDGDVADVAAVRRAVATAVDRFGGLDGVLHAAGVPGVGLMQFKTNAEMDRVLAPKVGGTAALAEALADVPVDFVALFSSIASATGALGQTDYCAANVYLDAFAASGALPHTRVVSIGWGEWTWNGWTAGLAGYEPAVREHLNKFRAEFGITFDEGWRALQRVLGGDHAHLVVSTQDFATMVERSHDFSVDTFQQATEQAREGADRHPRPNLSTEFVAAQAGPERTVADIWAESLGLDRVGAHDNFFELGGTSLLGIGIVDKVRRALSLDRLPAHVLYQAPTPGSLALAATGGSGTDAAAKGAGAADQRARMERRRDSLRGRRRS
jgi:NAD(P)-dependent dehydrogenase (short-subunit alcohol dehydrogenase family)